LKRNAKDCHSEYLILMYHKVDEVALDFIPAISVEMFQKQINFVNKFYDVVSLENIFNQRGKKTKVVITFDDGYRCIYKYAYPILKKYGIPATIFLTVDSINKNIPICPDLISYYFGATQKKHLEVTVYNNKLSLSLEDKESKMSSLKTIKSALKEVIEAERISIVEMIKNELEVGNPSDDRLQMLSWKDINEMAANGISFGGHTMTHPILTRLPLDKVKYEILESKRLIEKMINKPIYTFAYPNGEADDFSEEVKKIIRDSGYKIACTTIFGNNDVNSDLFELRRVYTSGNSLLKFMWRLRKAKRTEGMN